MRWNRKRRALLEEFEERVEEQLAEVSGRVAALRRGRSGSQMAMTAAWLAGALAVLAGGLYAGNEIRSRYRLKRRTPYDYYAHSGDRRYYARSGDRGEMEFGVGI